MIISSRSLKYLWVSSCLRRKMGYPTNCPGPWKVASPPRSLQNTSAPKVFRYSSPAPRFEASRAARPTVYTGECSRRTRVSGTSSLLRSPTSSLCSSHPSAYGVRPGRRRTSKTGSEERFPSSTFSRSLDYATGGAGVRRLLVGMVGAPDQGTALDVLKAELEAVLAQARKLFGRVVAAHRQVILRGPQVLADGQDVHLVLAQVAHSLVNLLFDLPQSHHEAALCQPLGVKLLDVAEDFERAVVLRLWSHRRVQARHGLDVVVEGVRPRADERLYRVAVALEVRGEDLDGAAGDLIPYLPDGLREDGGPAVLKLVAVDAGNNGVLETHLLRGLGDAVGLV